LRVIPVELPGRGGRSGESALTEFHPLVADLADKMVEFAKSDYVILGHSFGALLAYECALRLSSLYESEPLGLFVISCTSPRDYSNERFRRTWDREALEGELLSINERADQIIAEPSLAHLIMGQMKADFEAMAHIEYVRPRAPLSCPIFVLFGEDDTISASELDGWRECTNNDFQINAFSGGHSFFERDSSALLNYLSHQFDRLRHADHKLGGATFV